MISLALRTSFIYLILTLCLRLSGKRQVGQLQIGELVCALLLSELASVPIVDPNVPLLRALVPMALITSLEIACSCLFALFPILKKTVDGAPAILIDKGTLNVQELCKARLSPDELLSQLRLKGVPGLSQVDYAVLEPNGQLSVLLKKSAQPVTTGDLSLAPDDPDAEWSLILCGFYNRSNLRRFSLKEEDVRALIAPYSAREVLLFSIDDSGRQRLLLKSGLPAKNRNGAAKTAPEKKKR